MKKLNFSRVIIALALILIGTLPSFAHDFEVDGIYYNITSDTDKTVEVTEHYSYTIEYTGSVVIPSSVTYSGTTYSVTSIGKSAFDGCTRLKSVTIPNSVTSIGFYAFGGCTGLTEVNISDLSAWCKIDFAYEYANPLYYAGHLKLNGTEITNLVIPDDITEIKACAFSGCTGLISVTIPNSVTSIGASAFNDCSGLTSVTIPNSVTSIGSGAFSGCTGLTSITIGNSVTSIGNYAFRGCTGLTSITIPNSVSEIGWRAFLDCSGLTEVNISDLSAWCKIDFGDEYANPLYYAGHLKLNGTEITNLVIPDDITEIKAYAFFNCTGLTSVTIPNSVTSIGESAFGGCTGLTSVTIPNSVTSIGESAFGGCTGLTEVNYNAENCTSMGSSSNPVFGGCTNLKTINIGNSVKTIPSNAFRGCTGLTSVTIPNSVISIGNYAFNDCTNLAELIIVDGKESLSLGYNYYNGGGGLGLFWDCPLEKLYLGRSLDYNTSVLSGYSPFNKKSKLKKITIGNSVTEIGDYAFNGCSGLTSINIPNSVTEIGDYAFNGCTNLAELIIEDGKETLSLGYSYNGDFSVGHGLFYDCPLEKLYLGRNLDYYTKYYLGYSPFYKKSTLKEITIGNSVTTIGDNAFYGCTGLTSVIIPNSVTTIGDNAFYGCTGLTSVIIPNSVTEIGDDAFYDCSNLKFVINLSNLTFSKGYANYGHIAYYANQVVNAPNGYIDGDFVWAGNTLVRYFGKATELILPMDFNDKNYKIGNYAFYECDGLKNVTIPNSVTSIGDSAFRGCTGLTEVNISDLSAWCKIDFAEYANPLYYAGHLKLNGAEITDLVIPDDITEIKAFTFNGCSGLTSVNIPNSVTYIGGSAFSGCTGLTSITIGNSVTSIGAYAFRGCTGLTSVTIPNSVSEIGWRAFLDCSGLTSVTIGNSVTSIGDSAFRGSGLRLIFSYCMTPPACEDGAFYGCYSARLMVPEGTYYDYLVANEWYKFDKIQEIAGIEGVEADNNAVEVARYDIYGRQLTEPTKGINIIKMSDGSTRKEHVK